jgi:hypothetical protein
VKSPRHVALAGFLALAISAVAMAGLRPMSAVLTGEAAAATDSATARPNGKGAKGRGKVVPIAAAADPTVIAPIESGRPVRVRSVMRDNFRRDGAAEPRSLQVIAVPVPAELGSGQLDVSVIPQGRVELLSGRKGIVPADSAANRASTLVARVPAGATAGPLKVAEVEFTNDTMSATVTVELTVARVRKLTLRSTRPSTAIYPGERLHLVLIAQNLGNAPDTLRLTAAELPGWRLDRAIPTVVLTPGEQREIAVTIRTPPPPASGTVPVRLRSLEGASEIAALTVPVELIPDPSSARRQNGPTLVAGMATATGDSTGTSPVISLAVDGPLSEGVALRGRFVLPTDRADFNQFAMSRVGYFLDASFMTASGKGWSATGGRTGYSFSPLFGWNAYGLGASATISAGPWNAAVLASQERYFGMRGTGGNQFGMTVGRVLGQGVLTATATHLEQRVAFDRSLDALGLTYAHIVRPGMTLTGEAGYRSSEAGTGAAASARLDSRTPRGLISLYAAHAPGGSGAFARASDEINGSIWRQLSQRLALRGFGFGSKDDPGTGTETRSSGASIGPSFRLDQRTTLDLDVTGTRNKFDGDSSGSGSSELMTTLGARTTMRGVNIRASLGAGTTTRSTTFPDGSSFDRSGGRMVLRGGADTYTSRGIFSVDASLEKNDPSTGQVPSMAYVGVNASAVRLFAGGRAPTFNAAVWVNAYAGAPENGPAIRVGTDIPLPSQFALAIDAERNPYLRGTGMAPWVTVFRLERTIGLPGLRRPSARGQVFDDRNGNGVRDASEGGMGGVVVRHGSESMLTDANGRFRFYERVPATTVPTVEMSSLAIGQMAPSLPPAAEVEVWELPVMRTSRLQVVLTPTADSVGRLPTTPLTEFSAIATDSVGAIWIAHADTAGVAIFDALPSGRYTITVDLTASTERLRQLQSAPVIEITAGQELPVVRVPFGFRAVRVFDGGAGGAGGRRR